MWFWRLSRGVFVVAALVSLAPEDDVAQHLAVFAQKELLEDGFFGLPNRLRLVGNRIYAVALHLLPELRDLR